MASKATAACLLLLGLLVGAQGEAPKHTTLSPA